MCITEPAWIGVKAAVTPILARYVLYSIDWQAYQKIIVHMNDGNVDDERKEQRDDSEEAKHHDLVLISMDSHVSATKDLE